MLSWANYFTWILVSSSINLKWSYIQWCHSICIFNIQEFKVMIGKKSNLVMPALALFVRSSIPHPLPALCVGRGCWPSQAATDRLPCPLPSNCVHQWEVLVGDWRVGRGRGWAISPFPSLLGWHILYGSTSCISCPLCSHLTPVIPIPGFWLHLCFLFSPVKG